MKLEWYYIDSDLEYCTQQDNNENIKKKSYIFNRVESRRNLVILIGYALWSKESLEKDHAIWTKIENDRVAVWQIYEDKEET